MAKADVAVVPHVHENHVAVFVSELPMSHARVPVMVESRARHVAHI